MGTMIAPAGFAEPEGFSISAERPLPAMGTARAGLLERVGQWLDAWSMRSYGQDTHAWPAKLQVLRGLKAGPARMT